jgi:hypothetical protein
LIARPQRRRAAVMLAAFAAVGCTPVVRYTNALVSDQEGRTWFTRLPATIGGTIGFAVGVPVDVAILPATWIVYKTQPRETRDPLSVFLFPSFVLWKVGALVGTPFDLVEWAAYRSWQPARALTQQERESIENEWDSRGNFPEYPVTPIHPLPAPERPPGG